MAGIKSSLCNALKYVVQIFSILLIIIPWGCGASYPCNSAKNFFHPLVKWTSATQILHFVCKLCTFVPKKFIEVHKKVHKKIIGSHTQLVAMPSQTTQPDLYSYNKT